MRIQVGKRRKQIELYTPRVHGGGADGGGDGAVRSRRENKFIAWLIAFWFIEYEKKKRFVVWKLFRRRRNTNMIIW